VHGTITHLPAEAVRTGDVRDDIPPDELSGTY
jgi:hypothetical protein